MKVTERPLDLTSLAISSEQEAVRSSGVHVSTILKHIKNTIAPEKGKFTDEDLNSFAVIGRLWERVLADALYPAPRYERIGEIEKDGIIGSPDCVDTVEWAVTEIKVTWVSAKNFTERHKFREYLYQVKSYCMMLGMRRASLDVLHVCGSYAPPVPVATHYDLLFTPQELNEHWRMMKANVPVEMK